MNCTEVVSLFGLDRLGLAGIRPDRARRGVERRGRSVAGVPVAAMGVTLAFAALVGCGRSPDSATNKPSTVAVPAPRSPSAAAVAASPVVAAAAAAVVAANAEAAKAAAAAASAPNAAEPGTLAASAGAVDAAALVVHERAVLALVERWRDAQNRGDFGSYDLLYAERFEGTKRSGAATRTFARKGWMADRKRMFSKAMAVETNDPKVVVIGGMATVSFQQVWQSGNYKDVGPKQLTVVREGTELRIAREEMLQSSIGTLAQVDPIDRMKFAAIVQHESSIFVLLALGAEGVETSGLPVVVVASHVAMARRAIAAGKVPPVAEGWVGREVTMHGPNGKRCRGQVLQVQLLSRVEPHFSTVQRWQGEEGQIKPSAAEIRDEVWSLGQAGVQVVGVVVPVKGEDCRGTIWASAAVGEASQPLPEAKVEPALLAKALRSARGLAGWKTRQRDYAEATTLPRPEHWDAYDGGAPRLRAFLMAGGERLLWISLRAGAGCGDFGGEFWALWQVQGEGADAKLRLLSDDREPGRIVAPEMAIDVDGDGKVELIGVDGVLRAIGPTWRIDPSWELPSLDCGC